MTTEWGALAGVFPADESTFEWLEKRAAVLRRQEHPLAMMFSKICAQRVIGAIFAPTALL